MKRRIRSDEADYTACWIRILLILACFAASGVHGAVSGLQPFPLGEPTGIRTWSGAVDGRWSTPGNWSEGIAPSNGNRLVFGDSSALRLSHTNDLGGSYHSIDFTEGGYVIWLQAFGTNSLTLSAGIASRATSMVNSLIGDIHLATSQTFSVIGENGLAVFGQTLDTASHTLTLHVSDNNAGQLLYLSTSIRGAGAIRKTGPGDAFWNGSSILTSDVASVEVAEGGFRVDGDATTGCRNWHVGGADDPAWLIIAGDQLLPADSVITLRTNGQVFVSNEATVGSLVFESVGVVESSWEPLVITSNILVTAPVTGTVAGVLEFGGVGFCSLITTTGAVLAIDADVSAPSSPAVYVEGGGTTIFRGSLLLPELIIHGACAVQHGGYLNFSTLYLARDGAVLEGTGRVFRVECLPYAGFIRPGGEAVVGSFHTWQFLGHAASILEIDVGETTADRLVVVEEADLQSMQLAVRRLPYSSPPSIGTAFPILTRGSSSTPFGGLAEGATILADGVEFAITYEGGDGNDVVLTVTGLPGDDAPVVLVSPFTLAPPSNGSGVQVSVSVTGPLSASLALQGADSPAATNWTLLGSFLLTNGVGALSVDDPGANGGRYYRIIQP